MCSVLKTNRGSFSFGREKSVKFSYNEKDPYWM